MRPEVITVGASLGGLQAIMGVLRPLPADLPVPILIVQHRGPASDRGLAAMLQDHTALKVLEAEDKAPLAPGTVYIAAPDYHLLVEEPGAIALSTDAPVRSARPSIDVLFETAADAYGPGVLGVLLTGASADGASGLARIKAAGGKAIVQDPATAECATMPAAGIAAAPVDYILPLESIGEYLVTLVEGRRA
jgi:two-component system, chemotaxis family, protein-glutamate methylesterase/glutaminase